VRVFLPLGEACYLQPPSAIAGIVFRFGLSDDAPIGRIHFNRRH
jgi:hypothetical protein